MPPITPKLIALLAQLGLVFAYFWRRSQVGWRFDFNAAEDEVFGHGSEQVRVRHECTKIGWPVNAMIRRPLADSWLFDLKPQGRLHLEAELTTGHRAIDTRFFIAAESQHFAQVLANADALRAHLLWLPRLLERHGGHFARMSCEGRDFAIKAGVRWVSNRGALYAAVAEWITQFDTLLQAQRRGRPAAPRATPATMRNGDPEAARAPADLPRGGRSE